MKYKRLFLGICLTLLVVISQAQERVLPKFKLGGALRFNYNFCDWKPGHRDRGGDFGFDVLYFKLSGSYRNIILSADYRFYSKDFGGPMLKYGWIGYQFNDKSQMQLGLTGVPFGIQPIASHNFFLQIAYYIGLPMIDTVTTWPDGTKRSINSTDKPFINSGNLPGND